MELKQTLFRNNKVTRNNCKKRAKGGFKRSYGCKKLNKLKVTCTLEVSLSREIHCNEKKYVKNFPIEKCTMSLISSDLILRSRDALYKTVITRQGLGWNSQKEFRARRLRNREAITCNRSSVGFVSPLFCGRLFSVSRARLNCSPSFSQLTDHPLSGHPRLRQLTSRRISEPDVHFGSLRSKANTADICIDDTTKLSTTI